MNYPLMYIVVAVAWTVIETRLSLGRIEGDEKHWLNRALHHCRKWAKDKPLPISVGGRILACFVLAILAWIPVLFASAAWPVTVTLYILNHRNKEA
ncbi:hypothetical protein D0Q53_20830 [Salmonella enterica]|nr:hypothetical protein [Salmonella enterica]EBL0923976.1 hypothetical protein [Salmonella enterica]EFF4796175.1 hypothetical protein [Escherichia coli]